MNTANIFRAAWKVLPKVPLPLLYGIADVAAVTVWATQPPSVKQLRRNYEQFRGEKVPAIMVLRGLRSYYRAFVQQFTLPAWSRQQIREACVYHQASQTKDLMRDGPVILALTHSGNWDLAGAWFCQNYGKILTVAEKLEPEDLFNQFVEFRGELGMEIIGVGPGEKVFEQLVDRARGRSLLVPLLADRDISGTGVEVQLGASRALVAAGPAALAHRLGRPLIAGHISYRRHRGRWQIYAHFTDPIPPPEGLQGGALVEEWTRKWVHALKPAMDQHLVDWHMMQKVFVADLDPERLRRARERAAREEGV